MKTYLMNTSILTAPGAFRYRMVPLDQARAHLDDAEANGYTIESGIGHGATAQVMSELLGRHVAVNRVQCRTEPGDTCLVLKVRSRIPEGAILTREALDAIGYDFGIITHEAAS